MKIFFLFALLFCTTYRIIQVNGNGNDYITLPDLHEGMIIASNNGKALFLYKNGKKHSFPDFHTFTAMGFNGAAIKKMKSEDLSKVPKGPDDSEKHPKG